MATDPTYKTDGFPTRIHAASANQKLPESPNFQTKVTSFQIFPFIIYLEVELLYYKRLDWNIR